MTCRAVSRDLAKLLLVDDVELRSGSRLISFLSWVSRDLLHRAPFVRGLIIFICPPLYSEAEGEMLTYFFVFLRSVLTLRCLTLQDAEATLELHPNLVAAIAELTTIIDLALIDAGPRSCWLLRSTSSRLEYVNITIRDNGDDWEMNQDTHLAYSLATHTSSLGELRTISIWNLVAPGCPQYPNLRHLSVGEMELPIIEDYVHAFPNLQSLEVFEEEEEDCVYGWDDELTVITRHRERNIEARRHIGTWMQLRAFDGFFCALYAFGLTFHIPELCLTNMHHGLDLVALCTALEDGQPTMLELSISEVKWFLHPEFVSLMSGVNTVRDLGINLQPAPEEPKEEMEFDLESILVRVPRLLMIYWGWPCSSVIEQDTIVHILATLDCVESFLIMVDFYIPDLDGRSKNLEPRLVVHLGSQGEGMM
ncbi:hypothetical protein TRAPUB_1473 [Trametes pubescens]|uniref:F-box domain-containing protein n=1 Tax=Trametes pubescens TaxID=154538 RepID=A0A1M2VJA8_TRAPU|nr:hypothetical protein TRAPUB_1473 [Trametes pubescens]